MSEPAMAALKWMIASSLESAYGGGRAIGWGFVLRRDGEEIISICEGYARAPWEEINPGLPTTPDSRMQIASMSKVISACGLLVLIEDWNRVMDVAQEEYDNWENRPLAWPSDFRMVLGLLSSTRRRGLVRTVVRATGFPSAFVERVFNKPVRMSLDTTVASLLSEGLQSITLGAGVDQVTLRHVLSHKSHLDFRDLDCPYDEFGDRFNFWKCLIQFFSRPLTSIPPGINNQYSNAHYAIVRMVFDLYLAPGENGEDYERFIKRRILDPLGIPNISLANDSANVAALYYPNPVVGAGGALSSVPAPGLQGPASLKRTAGAGGWYASMRDLTRLLSAIQESAFLPEEVNSRLLDLDEPLGWYVPTEYPLPLSKSLTKDGGAWYGANGAMGILPNGLTAALITNTGGASASRVFLNALASVQPIIEVRPASGFLTPLVRIKNPLGFGDLLFTRNGTDPDPARSSPSFRSDLIIPTDVVLRASVWENGKQLTGPVEKSVTFTPENFRPAESSQKVLRKGIRWRYYEGSFNKVEEFEPLLPLAEGVSPVIDLSPRQREENFALIFEGFIKIPQEGVWTFSTSSDDGSRLWIGDTLLVDNDGPHGVTTVNGGILLRAGRHSLRVGYFQRGAGLVLKVKWRGPGIREQLIPASALFYAG